MMPESHEIPYRVPGRVGGVRPGAHRGTQAGTGTLFHGVSDFLHHRDLRRVDLRRTWVDPCQRLHVRVFEQCSVATVVVAADLSASMRVSGDKLGQVAALTRGLAAGARRLGDRFSFIGFGRGILHDWVMPPSAATGWVSDWCRRLETSSREDPDPGAGFLRRDAAAPGDIGKAVEPWWTGAGGALRLADWLPAEPSLVVLVSDFHWPEALIRGVLARLERHWVVPVVLWSQAEIDDWPRWGLRRVCDAETGREILVWLHPGWRRRLRARYWMRRRRLQRLFRVAGRMPLWQEDGLDFQAVARHFQEIGA